MKHAIAKKPSAPEKTVSTSKTAFDSLIETGAEWLEWIRESIRFENIIKNRIPWDQLNRDEREFIQSRLKSTSPENQLLVNSFYITMVAGFEEFLRSSIQRLASDITNKELTYEKSNSAIVRMNIRESAKLLRRMDSPPDYISFNEHDLCRGIGTCIPGSKKIELNHLALSDIEGLIKLENFFDRSGVFGIPLNWDILGKDQALMAALKIEKEKPREVGKQLADELKRVARNRNRIAHTGGEASDVTLQILSDHRSLLIALSKAIDAALTEPRQDG